MIGGGWDVQIHCGVRDVEPSRNSGFGTPSVTLGVDGSLSDPTVPMIYTNVYVENTEDSMAYIKALAAAPTQQGPDGPWVWQSENLRTMDVVSSIAFTSYNSLRVTGMEARDDGVMVLAIWEVSPAAGEDPDGEEVPN
jgi:hypothetical protein